jgi:hypothetical protein
LNPGLTPKLQHFPAAHAAGGGPPDQWRETKGQKSLQWVNLSSVYGLFMNHFSVLLGSPYNYSLTVQSQTPQKKNSVRNSLKFFPMCLKGWKPLTQSKTKPKPKRKNPTLKQPPNNKCAEKKLPKLKLPGSLLLAQITILIGKTWSRERQVEYLSLLARRKRGAQSYRGSFLMEAVIVLLIN